MIVRALKCFRKENVNLSVGRHSSGNACKRRSPRLHQKRRSTATYMPTSVHGYAEEPRDLQPFKHVDAAASHRACTRVLDCAGEREKQPAAERKPGTSITNDITRAPRRNDPQRRVLRRATNVFLSNPLQARYTANVVTFREASSHGRRKEN